ncbi:MAG TPA: GNAT family N-acetyltransferase [Longimicrobiaceae bacterium]|nr:GNAT family N-acetyltransferase [Longimicrobiaceae bacterium]
MTGVEALPGEAAFERAGPEHVEPLVEMMREFYAFEHLAWDEGAARQALDTLLGDGSLGEVWLVRRGGVPAGYFVLAVGFSLEFGGRYLLLDELYVREGHRGSGIGRLALGRAEEACRARGIGALRLEVERRNTGARAFYRVAGFHDHDRDLLTRWVPPVAEGG